MIISQQPRIRSRVGPIYRSADIFGRYRYIGIGKLDIGISHISIGIGIGYSGYRLYRYWSNIGKNTWILAKMSAFIGQNTSYRSKWPEMKISVLVTGLLVLIFRYRYRQKYWLGEYIGIGWTHIGPTLAGSIGNISEPDNKLYKLLLLGIYLRTSCKTPKI